MDIVQGLRKVVDGKDLAEEEAMRCMDGIMDGGATPAQIGAFLAALRMKGETVEEITGCVKSMRARVLKVDLGEAADAIDTCGTGGDGAGTINVSTLAALAAAGAGVKVAKHGNRSVSSACGSADLLESLGVNIRLSPAGVTACVREAGFGFMFAPLFHGAMKHAIGPRREMKIRTIFNLLGPLTNPAGVKRQVMGVFDPGLVEPLARVLARLGAEDAMVVHGEGGVDEVSITGETLVARVTGGEVRVETVAPADMGLERAGLGDVRGGDVEENRRVALAILSGEMRDARRDMVVANAAACLLVGGRAGSLAEGAEMAREALDGGKAAAVLERLVEVSGAAGGKEGEGNGKHPA